MLSTPAIWNRSSFCSENACVEVAVVGDRIAVRDGKDTTRPPLQFSRTAWHDFLDGVNEGLLES